MTSNNSHRLLETIRMAMEQSELLNTLATINQWAEENLSLVLGVAPRPLTADEIEQLVSQGNRSDNWSMVEVSPDFTAEHVCGNRFIGRVVLGHFTGSPAEFDVGTVLPTGVSDSTLKDCEIGDEALIHHVGLISDALVGPHATIVATSSVTGNDETLYGCDLALPPGIETCRQRLGVFAELTTSTLAELLELFDDEDFRVDYESLLEQYVIEATGRWTIVDEAAVIHDAGRIVGSYIGRATEVRGATVIENSCVISDEQQPTSITDGACLYGSIVQWGGRVATHAVVHDSVIGEQAIVEHGASVSETYVGANSHVARGEITASLLGPFVVLHHESLLIAATWPAGRGNIGSGAQIGSNHTGRAADQSIRCGEGLFFGLGCQVKFPADFTASPHTVLAAGVTTLPQRLEFPFSLVNTPTMSVDGLSPAFNQLVPGWVLQQSLYQVCRNDEKHRRRDRARHDVLEIDSLSPPTIQLMRDAIERLEAAPTQNIYTTDDIDGLGKNFMTRSDLEAGVETYRGHINWFAFRGVKQRLEAAGVGASSPGAVDCLGQDSENPGWSLARELLDGRTDIPEILEELRTIERARAENIEASRKRDDRRTAQVFGGAIPARTPAEDDAVVKLGWAAFEQISTEIDSLLI